MAEPALPKLSRLELPKRHERALANGLTLVAAERTRVPLVSACLVFPAGSARDPRGKAGLADFTLELLRRGSERLTADQIDESLELMGIDLRLETSPDSMYVMATAPSEHLEPLLLLAELVQRPAFAPEELRQARKRAVARLQTDLDEPSVVAADALGLVALDGHPYAHPGRGLASQVARFTRSDCLRFAREHLRPEGAFLVVTGDAPFERALELGERVFGRWKGEGGRLEPLAPTPAIDRRSILVIDKPGATQAQVRIASRAPGITDLDSLATRLSCQILGGGFTSRLVEAIRVNRGLSYSVSSFVTDTQAGGLFVISTHTKTDSVAEIVEVALEQTRLYREQGPTSEELGRAKRYNNGIFPLMIETDEQYGRAVADNRRFGRPADWLETFRERVQRVGAQEALDTARRYFLSEGAALAVVGEAKPIARALAPLGRVKVLPVEKLA